MKKKKEVMKLFLFLVFLLQGCFLADTSPNINTFIKENLQLRTFAYNQDKPVQYDSLEIDYTVAGDTPVFLIDLGGKKVSILKCSTQLLRPYILSKNELPNLPGYPDGSFYWEVGKKDSSQYRFLIGGNEILYFRADARGVIWSADGKKKYSFPLTLENAKELFGEPDSIATGFTW